MIQRVTLNSKAPSFKANIDNRFLNAANEFYKNGNAKTYDQYCSAIRRFFEMPDTDNITIRYAKEYNGGQATHILYATQPGKRNVILAKKDVFRKLLDKFLYMNEYEFKIKTGLIEKNNSN